MEIIELDANPQCRNHDLVDSAYKILRTCRNTCSHLLSAHHKCSIGERENCLDILRAMFITSCAGFDAAIKATIENALKDASWYSELTETNTPVRKAYEQWVHAYVFKDTSESNQQKRLTHLLLNGHECFIEKFIDSELNKGSLLNKGKINKINQWLLARALSDDEISRYDGIFNMRHTIVHKLDFDVQTCERIQRNANQLIDATNDVLVLAEKILIAVDLSICETTNVGLDHDEDKQAALRYLQLEELIQHYRDNPEVHESDKARYGFL